MSNFTPQQIEEFLQEFFDVAGARQYVGARYVPIFGRAGEATIEWDDLAPYEPLTVVMHQGVSYVSRRYVPKDIPITNTAYWVETYRFNAQVEQYRQEVLSFQGQIDDIRQDFVPFPDEATLPKYGSEGQVLSTLTNGKTEWVDPVVPSDAQAEAVITAWLDEHPEATTTVQDGSITNVKIHDDTITDAKLVQSGGILTREQELRVAARNIYSSFAEIPKVNPFDKNLMTKGAFLRADGTTTNYAGWNITDLMPVTKNARYNAYGNLSSDAARAGYYDADGVFISGSAFQPYNNNEMHYLTNVPSTAKYVRFSLTNNAADSFVYEIDTEYMHNPNSINGYSIVSALKDHLIAGEYWTTTGSVSTSASWTRTGLIPVKQGDYIECRNGFSQWLTAFSPSKVLVEYIQVSTATNYTVPSGVGFIGLNVLAANVDTFECTINNIPALTYYDFDWLRTKPISIWTQKSYISHGDSITWQDGKAYGQGEHSGEIARGYQTIFNENVDLKSYNNQGKSGWSMAIVNGSGIVNTIMAIADYTDYELCTIACGTNDFKLNVPLGTLGVIGDTTFDDTTFYGAYRKAIEYVLTNSPTIRIVLMTPLQRDNAGYDVNYTNSAGCKLIDYVNAIKSIGEMYGLPVCDMYANSGFTKKTLATYTMDGLHPNDIGYERMGGYLTGFLDAIGN